MTVVPIYEAIELVKDIVVPALNALTPRDVIWWTNMNGSSARPFVVVQPQDQGGIAVKRLNSMGWSGLITVKALADHGKTAADLLALVAPGMDGLVSPSGYDLSVEYQRPLALPVSDKVWQCGHIWLLTLERALTGGADILDAGGAAITDADGELVTET